MAKSLERDGPTAYTPLERDLAEALERIEAVLDKRPGAFINEDEATRQMREIIKNALKKVRATISLRRLPWLKGKY